MSKFESTFKAAIAENERRILIDSLRASPELSLGEIHKLSKGGLGRLFREITIADLIGNGGARPAAAPAAQRGRPDKAAKAKAAAPAVVSPRAPVAGKPASVLTDTPSFQGADEYLTQAHDATTLPCLRKDFLYDPYQDAEARALSADCILIIMASLSDDQAAELEAAATEWGMDVLIEVHDRAELDRAQLLKSPLIGINNRNLHSFDVTLDTTRQLARLVPEDRLIVSESGLYTPDDLADLARFGARCFLIGEA